MFLSGFNHGLPQWSEFHVGEIYDPADAAVAIWSAAGLEGSGLHELGLGLVPVE
jgi:hypothetical protein